MNRIQSPAMMFRDLVWSRDESPDPFLRVSVSKVLSQSRDCRSRSHSPAYCLKYSNVTN